MLTMPKTPAWITRLDNALSRAEAALVPYGGAVTEGTLTELFTDCYILAEVHALNLDAILEQADNMAAAEVGEAQRRVPRSARTDEEAGQ